MGRGVSVPWIERRAWRVELAAKVAGRCLRVMRTRKQKGVFGPFFRARENSAARCLHLGRSGPLEFVRLALLLLAFRQVLQFCEVFIDYPVVNECHYQVTRKPWIVQ